MAATIVKGLKAGDFCITFGAEGFLVGLGTAGFAPCFSVTKAVCQVRRHGRQILEESEQSKSACLKWRPSTLEDANALLLYIHEESPRRYCPTTMCHVPRLFSARCSDRFAQSPQGRNRGRRCSLARPRLASLLHSSIFDAIPSSRPSPVRSYTCLRRTTGARRKCTSGGDVLLQLEVLRHGRR